MKSLSGALCTDVTYNKANARQEHEKHYGLSFMLVGTRHCSAGAFGAFYSRHLKTRPIVTLIRARRRDLLLSDLFYVTGSVKFIYTFPEA